MFDHLVLRLPASSLAMERDGGLVTGDKAPPEVPMDAPSSAWSMALAANPVLASPGSWRRDPLSRSSRSLVVDDSGFGAAPQWKFDDLKSWIWLQKAIHPELDYDLCLRKKWMPPKMAPWSGISLRKWVKERKQKRKEEARLHKAEVHAAVSVAGVAAALAAVAAESSGPAAAAGQAVARGSALRETAVASAAALIAAQCAEVAEAAGATREQVAAAVDAAVAATDASNIITLTAAAATSLRGAAILRGRRGGQKERTDRATSTLPQDHFDFDFDLRRSKASLVKGDEMLVAMPDGKWKLHLVSAALNREGKIVLKIKKINLVMAFSTAKESIVQDVQPCAPEKASREEGAAYAMEISTTKGKAELRVGDYGVYKRWVTTLNHLMMLPAALGRHQTPPRGH